MIQQTSIDAYEELELGKNQEIVMSLFDRHGELTDNEIMRKLGWGINKVTGRRNELVKYGLVEDSGRVKEDFLTGRKNIIWRKI